MLVVRGDTRIFYGSVDGEPRVVGVGWNLGVVDGVQWSERIGLRGSGVEGVSRSLSACGRKWSFDFGV